MNDAKKAPSPKTAGYPVTEVGKDDVKVKGRFMSGTGQKKYSKMRGTGAATRGTKFLNM